MAKKNKNKENGQQALEQYLTQVGYNIEDVLVNMGFPEQAVINVTDHVLTVAFPLHEDSLGAGLIGTKFYSYTVELSCSKKNYTDKIIAPYGTNPKEFVVGLVKIYECINEMVGSLKKSKVIVDFAVAVPAGTTTGMLRYVVLVVPKNFENVVPVPQPYEQLENNGVDVYNQTGFTSNLSNNIQTNIPEGQGVYEEPKSDYHQPTPEEQIILGGIGPMGPVKTNKQAQPPQKKGSPYETVKPVQDYGYNPYADSYNQEQ